MSTGNQVFIGATPERHISVQDSLAVMNPISGTYRYDANGPSLDAVMGFLPTPRNPMSSTWWWTKN